MRRDKKRRKRKRKEKKKARKEKRKRREEGTRESRPVHTVSGVVHPARTTSVSASAVLRATPMSAIRAIRTQTRPWALSKAALSGARDTLPPSRRYCTRTAAALGTPWVETC